MTEIDKKEVLKYMIYCIIEGDYSIDRAKTDAENYFETSVSLGKGDMVYIRSQIQEFVRKNEQWYDDSGKLITSDQGKTLLSLLPTF